MSDDKITIRGSPMNATRVEVWDDSDLIPRRVAAAYKRKTGKWEWMARNGDDARRKESTTMSLAVEAMMRAVKRLGVRT